MGSTMQSTVGCFPELCFLQFSVAQVFVGLRKQFINNIVFPTWACAAGFNNNNIINTVLVVWATMDLMIINLFINFECFISISDAQIRTHLQQLFVAISFNMFWKYVSAHNSLQNVQ